jgi:hypothetical protein
MVSGLELLKVKTKFNPNGLKMHPESNGMRRLAKNKHM